MSYDLKSLRQELTSKNVADKGLVAIAQTFSGNGFLGSLIAETSTKKYAISMIGSKLAIIPFNYNNIEFESSVAFDKMIIEKAKVTGDGIFLLSKLKILTIDGKMHEYIILQGRKTVKQILKELDLNI